MSTRYVFVKHLLNVLKEYKPNMLESNCMPFFILSMHNGDTACKLFVIPCANIQKEFRAKQKRQMAPELIRFQHDNVAWR